MMRGGRTALLIGGLTLAACATPKEVSITPIADPAAKLAAGDLAAARGQLVLGNAGLALEAFRNIHRERPNDSRALAGIADCYGAMGRFDLAQSNYEAALALAPHDPVLLIGLAAIYQGQGDTIRAIALRHEAAAAATAAAPAPVAVAAAAPPAPAAVAVAAPPAPAAVAVAARPARTVAERAIIQPRAASPASPPPPAQIATAANASTGSITVKLPPARPVEMSAANVPAEAPPPAVEAQQAQPSSSVTVALPPARPAPALPSKQDEEPQVAIAPSTEPRLVRLSRGEVALVTSDRPVWRGQASAPKLASTNVQWIPLRDSTAKPNVQILNAARHQGLAGSARTVLLDRGWRKIAVGDAPATRETSVVYYPRNRSALGHSLAAQFGVRARQIDGDLLVLVLGRDGVNLVGSQRRS